MKIGVDFNDVILRRNKQIEEEILLREFKVAEQRPEKLTWSCFKKQGLSRRDFEAIRNMLFHPDYVERIEPHDGAFEAMRELLGLGCKLDVITSRPESCNLAQRWLADKSGLIIPFHGVGIDDCFKKKSKGPVLRELGIKIYLDNSSKKLRDIFLERYEFEVFPHLLHFKGGGVIEDDWSFPYAEPLLSWRLLPPMIKSMPELT